MINSPNDTLDDLKANDIDNLEHVLRGAKTFNFKTEREALEFQGQCLFPRLEELGLYASTVPSESLMQELMAEKEIRIETRPYENPEDQWRSGIYIYHKGEIAGFISLITKNEIFGYDVKTTIAPK